ncbi:MAG: metallophosphoesterase family protein [Solobacterium sp.]|nr:metallophosphoesterase family protein [Solobacterium sp.]
MKIVVVSDSHGNIRPLHQIMEKHADADLFIHCGDSGWNPSGLQGWTVVGGNVDYMYDYPLALIEEVGPHKILVTHGHACFSSYRPDYGALADYAKDLECDTVMFGHTHIFYDSTVHGVRLINPGSTYKNRDGSDPCYAVVTYDEEADTFTVERMPYIKGAKG